MKSPILNISQYIFFAFALLLIVGGIMGYVEKKSVISLVAGLLCGTMSLVAGFIVMSKPTVALALGIIASLMVGGSMAPRVIKSPKLFPGIVTVTASLVTLGVSIAALLSQRSGTQ